MAQNKKSILVKIYQEHIREGGDHSVQPKYQSQLSHSQRHQIRIDTFIKEKKHQTLISQKINRKITTDLSSNIKEVIRFHRYIYLEDQLTKNAYVFCQELKKKHKQQIRKGTYEVLKQTRRNDMLFFAQQLLKKNKKLVFCQKRCFSIIQASTFFTLMVVKVLNI
ncbi:unnamed protein product [Paramecium sonneborni]|uniref:Uncharacterized protein n=1 Tax=Paramecium sonneborni TaxID=65129 RepID=A0A8S1NPC3_9CILI|nr:unnamed protein product [Paramecium sonneborni]